MNAKKTDPTPQTEQRSGLYDLEGNPVDLFEIETMTADDYTGPVWVGNFSPLTDEYIELAFRSQQKSNVDPDSDAARKFPVTHWCIERHHRFRDDQGAKALGVTLSFFDADKTSLIVTSDIVLRFWQMAIRMRGVGPYDPPLNICLEKVKSGQGRMMIQLRIVSGK